MIAREIRHLGDLVVLSIVAVVSVEGVKADYVPNVIPTTWEDGPYDVRESTYQQIGDGVATADDNWDYVSCHAGAWTWVDGDSTDLSMMGAGELKYEWTWDGPGTPPGGTLSWELDADGESAVDGNNLDGTNANAFSYGYAPSGVYGFINEEFRTSEADGQVYGYVDDDDLAIGDAYAEGAWGEWPDEAPEHGSYHFALIWNSLDYGEEPVPAETTYVFVEAGAQCACQSVSQAASGSIAHSDTASEAYVDIGAEFP